MILAGGMDMGRVTVMHTAGLHLGTTFQKMPPEIGRQRRRDLMQTLTRITEMCRQRQTDILLIAGNLWENQHITRPQVDFVADQFRRIPSTTIVIAPGSSDAFYQESFYRHYPWPDNVHIFQGAGISSIWFSHLNLRVFGCGWTGAEPPQDLDWSQVQPDSGSQVMVIAHGTPETLKIPSRLLDMDHIAYIALGGNHSHKIWSRRVLDPGSPEPLSISDVGAKGVLVGNIGASTSLELQQLGSRHVHKITMDIGQYSSQAEILSAVQAAISDRNRDLFHLVLKGMRPQGSWDLAALREELKDVFYLWLEDNTDSNIDLGSLATEHNKGVVGKYITAIQESQLSSDIRKLALDYGLDALLTGGDS